MPALWLRGRPPQAGHICEECNRNNTSLTLIAAYDAMTAKMVEMHAQTNLSVPPPSKAGAS